MSNLDAQSILNTMRQPFLVLDSELVVRGANKRFYDTFDVKAVDTEDTLSMILRSNSGTFQGCARYSGTSFRTVMSYVYEAQDWRP